MDEAAFILGKIVMVLGGFLVAACIICLLAFAAACAWIAFSNSFRDICKAESLIFDYRKNREKFLEWREMEENMWKGRWEDLDGN